jgi:hypothetical protein
VKLAEIKPDQVFANQWETKSTFVLGVKGGVIPFYQGLLRSLEIKHYVE